MKYMLAIMALWFFLWGVYLYRRPDWDVIAVISWVGERTGSVRILNSCYLVILSVLTAYAAWDSAGPWEEGFNWYEVIVLVSTPLGIGFVVILAMLATFALWCLETKTLSIARTTPLIVLATVCTGILFVIVGGGVICAFFNPNFCS